MKLYGSSSYKISDTKEGKSVGMLRVQNTLIKKQLCQIIIKFRSDPSVRLYLSLLSMK